MPVRRTLLALAATAALGLSAVPASAADPVFAPGTAPLPSAPSLPSVDSGSRPGPDVLYAPPPRAPQLENRDFRFTAAPLLVSATEAYVAGEYLYSDYLYDDHGSLAMPVDPEQQTATDSTTVNGLSANALAFQVGSISYPTDPVYAGNAADLVEFRMVPGPQSTAYRFTLNTLRRADTTMVALALDTDRDPTTGTDTLPRDPGAAFPGTDAVLTTWGTGAEVSTFAADGALLRTTPVAVRADLEADQLTVTVPSAVQQPTGTVRATLATGLHEPSTGGWKRPKAGPATADQPGGAGIYDPSPSGVFNLGFRFTEPVQRQNTPPDEAQAEALRRHHPTAFARDIDVAALRSGAVRSTVPTSGLQIRMFPSRLRLGEGQQVDFPQALGQLQPYAVHLPPGGPDRRRGLLLSLHSNAQNYWQYDGTGVLSELGDARDAVVLSPLGRGNNGWYIGVSEYDVFEAWADLARHVRLDPDRVAISGYSMGGYAAYRLGGLYPDLFGKAFTVVGPPGKRMWVPPLPPSDGIQTLTNLWLENTRNVPYLNYAMAGDELVPIVGPVAHNTGNPAVGVRGFEQLGYRYRFLTFPAGEHYTLAALGYEFPLAREFLGQAEVDRDPAHVSFAYVPSSDDAALGLVHDHAYWISDVRLADTSAGPSAKGVIDVRSRGFGVGDPVSAPTQGAGVEGGLPYVEKGRTWSEARAEAVANAADVTLTNLRAATVQLDRARLTTGRPLTLAVTADRDSRLVLAGASGAAVTATRDGAPVTLTRRGSTLTLPVAAGTWVYVLTPTAAAEATGAGPDRVTDAGRRLPATGGAVPMALAALVLLAAATAVRRRAWERS